MTEKKTIRERMNAPEAQREQMLHNAALKRHYAPGTRVRRLKTGREGVITWYGRDKKRRVLGQGLPRIGVRWDGNTGVNFMGTAGIVRCDGLHLDDTKARRTTPSRRFKVLSTVGMPPSALTNDRGTGLFYGQRTLGDQDLTADEFAWLGEIAREHNAGALVVEVTPGSIGEFDSRGQTEAWDWARYLVGRYDRDGDRPRGIVFIDLDNKTHVVR